MNKGINTRIIIVDILKKIKESTINIDECFKIKTKKYNISDKDKKYIYNVVITTIKNINTIDQILEIFIKKINKKETSYYFIISALCQIFYLKQKEYAVINSTCEAYKRIKSKNNLNFINGLLRNISRNKLATKQETLRKSLHPSWFKKIIKGLPSQKRKAIYKSITKKTLINLVFKSTKNINIIKEKYIKTSENSLVLPSGKNIKNIPGYNEGYWWIQDYAATIPVKLIPNLKGKNVFDMCSAPGGKTFQLLNMGAKVISCDISEKRIKILKTNAKRLNFKLRIIKNDVLKISENKIYDAVLIDAPCSSIGTIKRNPEILFRSKSPDFDFFINLQYKMLEKAKNLLKANGILIFSVCSFNELEGIKQIERFLFNNRNFEIMPIKKHESKNYYKLITKEGLFQSYPSDLNNFGGVDGFFIARLIKKK